MTLSIPRSHVLFAAAIVTFACAAVSGQSVPAGSPPRFEVAAVKINGSGEPRERHTIVPASGQVTITNVTVSQLIQDAYGVQLPSLMATAPQDQLGLGLEAVRAPVEVLLIERAQPLSAEAPAPAAQAALPAFDVVSIRQNTSGTGAPTSRVEGGRYAASNIPLQQVISDAYRMTVAGGPEWIRSRPGPSSVGQTRFDIVATIPAGTPAAQIPLMLRTLLAERFKLAAHTETQNREAYALVHAREDKRLGSQLTPSTQQCQVEIEAGPLRAPVTRLTEEGKPVCGMMVGPAAIRGGGLTLRFLANAMTGFAGRLVVDRTGLEGPFDFALTYAPATARGGGPASSDNRASIFVAVQEQLGLKLEPTTAALEVLVVDNVSMPTEN